MRIGTSLTTTDLPLFGADELALFLGAVPGTWTHRLIELYAAADVSNQRRLGFGFPSLVVIYETWGQDYDGSDGRPRPPTPAQLEAELTRIAGPDWRFEMSGAVPLFIPSQPEGDER